MRVLRGLATAALTLALLAGCAAVGTPPVATRGPGGRPAQPSDGTPSIAKDVRYGDAPIEVLDVYQPAGRTPDLRPIVLFVHGGGFTAGDKASRDVQLLALPLARAGYVVASIDYGLAPAVTYPVPFRQVQAAVRWMRAHARSYGGDPARIVAVGESAGAVLVSEAGTAGRGVPTTGARVRAVVSLSGLTDFRLPAENVHPGAKRNALAYLGCSDFAHCPAASTASAVTTLDRSDPPFLFASSQEDFVPGDSDAVMAARMKRLGIPVRSITEPGSAHASQLLDGTDLQAQILSFLRAWS